MKRLFTLCFYEHPAALHEIKAWEHLKFDLIIKKERYGWGYIYIVETTADGPLLEESAQETLMCIRKDAELWNEALPSGSSNLASFIFDEAEEGEWNKLLMFGAFTPKELVAIGSFVELEVMGLNK
jgi:hypothetical protein